MRRSLQARQRHGIGRGRRCEDVQRRHQQLLSRAGGRGRRMGEDGAILRFELSTVVRRIERLVSVYGGVLHAETFELAGERFRTQEWCSSLGPGRLRHLQLGLRPRHEQVD